MKKDYKLLLDDSMLDDIANIILSLGHTHISNILDELLKKQENREKVYFEIRKKLEDQKETELNKLEAAFNDDQNSGKYSNIAYLEDIYVEKENTLVEDFEKKIIDVTQKFMEDLEEVLENQQKILEDIELPGFCITKNQEERTLQIAMIELLRNTLKDKEFSSPKT